VFALDALGFSLGINMQFVQFKALNTSTPQQKNPLNPVKTLIDLIIDVIYIAS
jgi:hypothetical protein